MESDRPMLDRHWCVVLVLAKLKWRFAQYFKAVWLSSCPAPTTILTPAATTPGKNARRVGKFT